jgi:small ubiquitin-related modifier
MADADTKPKDEASAETINLKVATQDGNEIFFKCKMTTPLSKLMNAFCQRQGVTMQSVRFLFDGQRINQDQTPKDLDMEDGDSIDVMVEQQGGARS